MLFRGLRVPNVLNKQLFRRWWQHRGEHKTQEQITLSLNSILFRNPPAPNCLNHSVFRKPSAPNCLNSSLFRRTPAHGNRSNISGHGVFLNSMLFRGLRVPSVLNKLLFRR